VAGAEDVDPRRRLDLLMKCMPIEA